MATRSFIGILNDNKIIEKGICCHYDGYPEHQFPILTKSYSTVSEVDRLIELGSLSSLGEQIEPSELVKKFGFSKTFNPEFKCLPKDEQDRLEKEDEELSYCLAYHRDRGEHLDIIMRPTYSEIEGARCEWVYLFYKGKWSKFRVSQLNISSGKYYYKELLDD